MTRVTQSMLSSNMLRNLNTSYGKMSKMQDNLNSGMKITRASDDPVVAVKGMKYRTQLDKIDQFIRNTNEATAWLDTTDEALGLAGDALNRVKELVVQAANDTNTTEDRAKIKAEMDQLREQIRDIGNTRVGGKSIFTGTNTQQKLFVDVVYFDPKGIKAHYDSLAPTPPATGISQAQRDFIDGVNTDPEGYLTGLSPEIEKITSRILNTKYEDLNGKTISQLDALSQIALPYSQTVSDPPPPHNPNAKSSVVTTETETEIKTVVIEVGDTATTETTYISKKTSTAPNLKESAIKSGTEDVKMEVFDGIQLSVNFPGADIFGRMDELMAKVLDALDPAKNPNHKNIQSLLGDIADPSGQNKKDDLSVIQNLILDGRADVGARQNRLELMENRLDIHKINITKQKSINEDTDYAETITKMTTQESIHQAALSVGSKIIQQTLVDFMR